MTVKTALQFMNAALDDGLSNQEADYDAETRFAITWFETHSMEAGPYGEAETLAKARNVSVSGIKDSALVKAGGGKAASVCLHAEAAVRQTLPKPCLDGQPPAVTDVSAAGPSP
jgi:putative DNA methylase